MADKSDEQKKGKEEKIAVLEREYIIPLRKGWLKVPKYRRAERAITEIKKFLVRHMKIYDRDLKKIKIDRYLNEEIWFRGIKKPPAKIKVKAVKYLDNSVYASLAEIPEYLKFKIAREERIKKESQKKTEIKSREKGEEQEKEKAEGKVEEAKKEKESEKKEEKTEEKEFEKDEKDRKEKQEILKKENKEIKKKLIPKEKEIKKIKEKKPQIRKFATGR